MKVDVVISACNRYEQMGRVMAGLHLNRDHINNVYVVCDDLEEGFGVSRCKNNANRIAETEYVLHIDNDIMLDQGAIEKLIEQAAPGKLVFAKRRSDFEATTDIQPSKLKDTIERFLNLCGGCCFLVHKRSFEDMGGWHPNMLDYGWQDNYFILKWLLMYGIGSVVVSAASCWHFDANGTHSYQKRGFNYTLVAPLFGAFRKRWPDATLTGVDDEGRCCGSLVQRLQNTRANN